MDWYILGIEPTKDKRVITAAYREKLRYTNPEDKPEEFKILRETYENAMAFAEKDTAEVECDDSPVGVWIKSIIDLYNNYAERIKPYNWEALMHNDVCVALDYRPIAEKELLNFLLDNYFLPQGVWKVLNNTFNFSDRLEELYELWPRTFVDNAIMGGLLFEDNLPYNMFIPGTCATDCDAYRRLYFQANQTPIDEMEYILEQMDSLSESHPYGEALKYQYFLVMNRTDEGKDGLRRLKDEYPDNPYLLLNWADFCLEDGNIQEAESIANRILILDPVHLGAKRIYAHCLANKGLFREAKKISFEMMHSCGGDPVVVDQIVKQVTEWNEEYIKVCETRYDEAPEDTDNAIELAWCYSQNDRINDAIHFAEKIDPKMSDPFEYHNLMGKLYYSYTDYDNAMKHLQIIESLIKELKSDGTDKTENWIKKLPEILQIQGSCLMQMGKMDEAKAKLNDAFSIAPEDPEVMLLMAKLLYSVGDYTYATDVLQHLINSNPGAWYAESLLALSLFKLGRDGEAFDAINRSIEVCSNDLSLYVIKLQILMRNGIWEGVHEILAFLEESGAPQNISIDYIKAQLIELEQKDIKGAYQEYKAISNRVESGEIFLDASDLYYRLAVLTAKQIDVRREENRKTIIELLDKSLEYDDFNEDSLAYKARIMKDAGLTKEVIEMYKTLEEKNPNSLVVQRGLASLYYENLSLNAEEALVYYERILETQRTADLYFYAANCKRRLGDLEGAKEYYVKELEMDADDIDGYRGLALICDMEGDYEKSLGYLEKAIEIMDTFGQQYDWLLDHKVKILRRLGRYNEALSFVDELMTRYNFEGYQTKFDICCQFGLWDKAMRVLEQWKKARGSDSKLKVANGKIHILMGNMFKAVVAIGTAKNSISFDEAQSFRLQFAELECNYSRQVHFWKSSVKIDPENDYSKMQLAMAYWHLGKKEDARTVAREALDILEDILSKKVNSPTLYRSRRCVVLAILGRIEEAKEELIKVRNMPLCEHCVYGSCKDADIYEAFIEELIGNKDNALALYNIGKSKWPDDIDFTVGKNRLKGKEK